MAINPKLLEFLEQDQTGRKNSAGLGTLPTNSAGPINPMAQLMADLANNKLDLDMDVTENPAQRIKNDIAIKADEAKKKEEVPFTLNPYGLKTPNSGVLDTKYTRFRNTEDNTNNQATRLLANYGLGAASGTVALGESAVDIAKGIKMAAPQYAETPFVLDPYGLTMPSSGVLNTKYNQFGNSVENAQNMAKVIDAYLLGKNLSAREPGKLSDKINEKRENYDSQFDDSGFLGKTLDLVNQAAFSSGQMLPSVVAARVADVILPGSGEIAGIIPIAMTSSSSYNREAYQNMREQNAKLEAEGKQPKFSEKEMIRISGAAGLFGALIEAGGELMLGGVEGMTQNGIAKIPFVKKLMETVTNPVVKTFWRGMISFTNEGSEEVIQGIASNAMKKFLYDDSQTVFKGNGEEYFDSFIVGGLMGFSGNIAPAVQNTVGFNAARNEVAKLVQAADAVTSKTEAADASVAIAAIKERNDTNIRAILDAENSLTLDENFNVTEERATKKDIEDNRKGLIDILEWENERLDTILDVLADKNVSTDIIENNKIRNGNTDVNSLRTGIEQFYEGGEAQNFQNARNERIAGEKGTEYGLNLRQAAEGETAEQRRTRLDENMAAIREYEQEHRDEIRNRKRAQRLHENAEAFKKVLEGYGIKDIVVDEDNLTFYDKKTGTVHIAASTSTDKAMNIKVGHEIGHAISNADANFVNDMLSFMRGRNINVDELVENAKENYIKYLQKTESITESQARQKVDNDYAKEEVICEFLGQLNARSGILDAMAKQNRSLLRRVYNRVMDLVDKYTGNTGIARRYRQLAKDIRTVLEANGMEAGEIKDTAETAAQARIENKNKTARDSGSRSRNSAVDGNTADATGRPGDSVSQNDQTVNRKYRIDSEYEEAVESGNEKRQTELVMQAAKKAGYDSPILYHGTGTFGFTTFDVNKMDDKRSIFATSRLDVAETYSGINGITEIRRNAANIDNLSGNEIAEELQRVSDNGFELGYYQPVFSYSTSNEIDSLIKGNKEKIKTLETMAEKALKEYQKKVESGQGNSENNDAVIYNLEKIIKGTNEGDFRSIVTALWKLDLYPEKNGYEYPFEGKDQAKKILDSLSAEASIEDVDTSNGVIFIRDNGYTEAMSIDDARTNIKDASGSGNYQLVAKTGKPLVVEADGKVWNKLKNISVYTKDNTDIIEADGNIYLVDNLGNRLTSVDAEKSKALSEESVRNLLLQKAEYSTKVNYGLNTTRDYSAFAKKMGYDSVIFKNLVDMGGLKYGQDITESDVYIIFNPANLKSADPVTYDDAGNVIPLSERFNSENQDIRYRAEDDENVSRETEKKSKKPVNHRTGSKADIKAKSKVVRKNAKAMEDYAVTPLSEFEGKERETAIDMKLRYWDKMASMYKRQGSVAGDAEKELLMTNFQEGIFGDPNTILAQAKFMEMLSEIGNKEDKERFASFMLGASAEIQNALDKKEAAKREQQKKDLAVQRELDYERAAFEFNRDTAAPLPNAPTNEEAVIETTDEFVDAPPGFKETMEQAIAYDTAKEEERQREKQHFYSRAEQLAEQYNLDNTYDMPTRETYNGEDITPEDLEGIDIPSLEAKPTVKDKVESERIARAEIQIMDAIREYDHEKELIRKRAQAMEAKQTRKLAEGIRDKIQGAIKKLVPMAAFRNSEAVSEENKLTAEETISRDKEQKAIRNRMKLLEKRMYDVETDTSLIKEWKYSDADHRAELENQYETVREYAGLYRRAAEIRQQKSSGKAYKNDFYRIGAELQKRLSSLGGFPTVEELDDIGAWILTELVDYTNSQKQDVQDFIHEYNSMDEKDRAKLLKTAEERLGKTKAREVTGILNLYDQVFDATFGIDEKLHEIKEKWKNFEEDTIKNSRKLSAQKERYESYQADIDVARFHLGSDITPEQLEKIRAEIDEKRKTLDKMRIEISDADRISARRFLDDNANVEKSERETARYLRAYAVAEFILGEEEQSKLEADEAAVSRLESQYRTAKEKSDAFRKEHRKEMDRYTRQGFTDDSAEIFVRRDIRMQEERELNKNSVLAKLGYKIAAPIRDDYGMSSVILESEAKAKEIGNRIAEYIEYNTVSKYVVGIAKDIAAGKMTLLEVDSTPQYRDIMGKRVATGKTSKVLPSSGLTGANLDHARVLSTLYAEQNDYLEGGIKARKRAISDELSSTLDAVFSDYDFAANLKESGKLSNTIFDTLMHYSSPENIMTDVFGDNGVADYLTEQYITPVIRNAAEARRMTNRQTKRLNDLNLTKQESALTQIIAEYSNLRDITEAVNSDVDGETIINLGTLINLLQGSMSAEEFARRIARAKAGEAFDGKKMSNFAKQQTKASKEAYDEAYLHSEEVEEMHEEAEANADYNDKDAYGGEEWEGLVETLKQIQYQAKGADAKKIAEKCMKAAETCRELMNNMYDAFNEMYVTHGGQRMNFRKDYMPHQQSEDVRTKMDEIMKMMDLDPVKEIPTAIKGRTRDNRPYSKWLSFRQRRTGEKTNYDAVGNIYNYLSAANQALYHIDDIFKLRHLETYVRSIHERELQDFHQVIADHMVNADIMEGDNGPKTSNTQFGRFAEWLKLYTDDLCGKQVYRDAESMYGRPHLNKWAWVQRMSNKTMLAFNLASAMKQISQVPTVMSELGVTDTIDAFMDAMNDNNVNQITYDILGRSTFLAEKEKIEEIDYREYRNRKEETVGGILNSLDKRDASIGSILKDKADTLSDYLQGFDRFNSRFAVYAYFKQGMDNGMTSDEALAYADRRARQINASRLRGAQPLAFRNKGVIQGILNMYQRETVAQIENLAKYMPRQMKKFYDENGKEATAKLITKRIVQHQLITAAFNTAFYALGIGTPAMFDVLGSIIRAAWSNFKHIPGDDERDLFEKIIGAGGNLGDEIMDDLPIVSTIYELVAGDSTNRLPIYSVDLKKIAKAITNCKTLKQLHEKLENSGSELEAKMIKEMMDEETEAAGVNILLTALNLSGAFVEGGSQMRKTITALIDLAHGGRYSHGAGAGNLQYEVGARDAIPALLFGTSGLPQAKDYYAGNAGLSSTATQVYKDLLGQGMSTEKAYDIVREVSKQKNNAEKNKTLDKLKIGMEAKSSIYMGMIASDAEKRAYDLAAYGLGGIDKAVVGLAIRDIKAESLQSDKIGKLLESGLNNQQTEDIYMQMIAYWETDENGHRVKITDTDKYLACREAGMDIKDYLTAKKAYKEIYDKDISATQKASELYRWAKQSGDYSDRQISAITENFSYYSNVKANADSYRKYEDAGIDLDTSMEIYDSMRGKMTNASKIDTLIGLNLAKDDLRNALSATLSESTWNLVKDGLDNGMNIKNYAKVIKADADGNKRLSKDERKAAIDKIPGLTDADRSVLWIATGGSAVNNPYEGTQKKQTGFGSGLGAGFGSGFGSGFGTGFGSGFGTSSNDDDPDGFLAAALNAYKK